MNNLKWVGVILVNVIGWGWVNAERASENAEKLDKMSVQHDAIIDALRVSLDAQATHTANQVRYYEIMVNKHFPSMEVQDH